MIAVLVIQGISAALTVFYLWLPGPDGVALRRFLPFIWLFQILAVQFDTYLGHRQTFWLAETLWGVAWVIITTCFAVRWRRNGWFRLILY